MKADDPLFFDPEAFTVETVELSGRKACFRAYEGIPYCTRPKDPIQRMNVFVPLAYATGERVGKWTSKTAPIFLPNTVGGYMPGPATRPGMDSHTGRPNSLFEALLHGYVVVSAGVRGRTSGKVSREFFEGSVEGSLGEGTGRMVGRAPAFLVDLKAAIRFIRHNQERFPGDTEHIITNGTSAGGALSALAGTSGNEEAFLPYLEKIGAARERDDIFAASCYCPICNLEHADAAYEWQYGGENHFYRTRHERDELGHVRRVPFDGELTAQQMRISLELASLFPGYVNSLQLRDSKGRTLSLEADGTGSFRDYCFSYLEKSILEEAHSLAGETTLKDLISPQSHLLSQEYFQIEGDHVTGFDWKAYAHQTTRMKAPPAFDALDLSSPENEEFGDEVVEARHFTDYSYAHSKAKAAQMAEESMIALMNPISHLVKGEGKVCRHWRIRHGSFDRDTSLAIPTILAAMLEQKGYKVDFALPWGLPHSGDYDLPSLFAWIDQAVLGD